MKWKLVIWGDNRSENLEVELQHEYETADEAAREAENLADYLFEEDDEGWCVSPLVDREQKISEIVTFWAAIVVEYVRHDDIDQLESYLHWLASMETMTDAYVDTLCDDYFPKED